MTSMNTYIIALLNVLASLVAVSADVVDSRLLGPSKALGAEESVYNLLIYDDCPKINIKFVVSEGEICHYSVYQNEPTSIFRSISKIVKSKQYENGYVVAFNELDENKLMERAMIIFVEHGPTGSRLCAEWIRLSQNLEIMKVVIAEKSNYGKLIMLKTSLEANK